MHRTIFIIGGSGMIGKALSRELSRRGHSPVVLTRNLALAGKSNGHADYVHWDGKDPRSLAGMLGDADGVVNLAGANLSSRPWTPGYRQKIVSSRIVPGKALSEAIGLSWKKPKFVIQGSASGYYGTDPEKPCTEKNPPGDGFLAETVIKWESSVKDIEQYGVRQVWIRTGPVLDKDRGLLFFLLMPFILRISIIPGPGTQWLPWIHLEDMVSGICHLVDDGECQGPFNLTAPHPVTLRELIYAIENHRHKLIRLRIPSSVLKFLLREMAEETILSSQYVIPEKLVQSGYRFKFSDPGPAIHDLLTKKLS